MKYPIGIQSFDRIIEGGYVYVDKTDMVYSLVKEGSIYFLSRPRRFGKSLLVSTLKNYFLGRKELFKGLKIDALEKDWNVYPVFHIDFNGRNYTREGTLRNVILNYITDWEKEYGIESNSELLVECRFIRLLEYVHKVTGRRAVVLVDDYDRPVLDVLGYNSTLVKEYLNVLNAFYSVFKSADEHLHFVFLTGVTNISQIRNSSGMNQFDDITMYWKYDALCGISHEELFTIFKESIVDMAEDCGCSFDDMLIRLKKQYGGYCFSSPDTDVYNPYSLFNAFLNDGLYSSGLWNAVPSSLFRLMSQTDRTINEFTDRCCSPMEFIYSMADVDNPLPMIYNSGCLTIKEFDLWFNMYTLDFPNDVVKYDFLSLMASDYFNQKSMIGPCIREFVSSLKKGNIDDFRTGLTSFLASIPYTMRRKENEREKERYFHYTFYLLMRLISVYTVYTEKVQSHGRVDCIVETKDFIYIFEFKLDGTVDEAMQQIEDKGYADEYASDSRRLYKIGAVFSSETGTIEDWKCI